jgi:histidinol-phosphate/aromatic aminotransferase/cobyric acid decarboxylase-like protein
VWLNANESPWTSPADEGGRLNRYPEPQPAALRDRLATLYGVAPERAMVTRGSDEGIDLLVRAFCRAGIDGVLIAPPCFGMYAVCARVQNAPLVEVPLIDEDDHASPSISRPSRISSRGATSAWCSSVHPRTPRGRRWPARTSCVSRRPAPDARCWWSTRRTRSSRPRKASSISSTRTRTSSCCAPYRRRMPSRARASAP